jgi:hypothetical protein
MLQGVYQLQNKGCEVNIQIFSAILPLVKGFGHMTTSQIKTTGSRKEEGSTRDW